MKIWWSNLHSLIKVNKILFLLKPYIFLGLWILWLNVFSVLLCLYFGSISWLWFSVEPSEFLAYIEVAEEDLDDERIEALLCGAVKQLKQNRFKPDPIMYLSLMHLAKTKPMIFNTEVVIEVRRNTYICN